MARDQLSATYLDAAGRLIDEKRFTVASQLLDKAEQLTPKSAALQARRAQWTQASERNKVERAAEELAARVAAAKQRFGNEVKAGRLDRARGTLVELQTIAPKDDAFVRDAPAMLADAASRRVDGLLSSQEPIDRAALSSAAETYRAVAPQSYRSRSSAWLATIKQRLADLGSDAAAHNAYLAAVQSAFVDLTALQALRPIEPKVVELKPVEPKPVAATAAATQSPQVADRRRPRRRLPSRVCWAIGAATVSAWRSRRTSTPSSSVAGAPSSIPSFAISARVTALRCHGPTRRSVRW
jgi:hypothetical protein